MENEMEDSFVEHLERFIGETVTIYTTSGGQSGCGFTGCILRVNPCFVRLVTRIGAAPGCAVGSSCERCRRDPCNFSIRNIGSVCDIPIDRIACFVHNAV
jgi:hypothetical protein